MKRIRLLLVLILALGPPPFSTPAPAKSQPVHAAVRISRITYHGWPDSFVMSNGKADVVIVPAIGRVMQFHFADDSDGPFFENRVMDGKAPDPSSKDWGNFGGDKSWPSPQADWGKITGREWPPPVAFDSMPVAARVAGESIDLVSSLDPAYGIRETRHIQLDRNKPVLTITTTYEKVQGDPVKVGVWVITQLRDPQRAFMVLPRKSQYAEGYNKQMQVLPKDLKVEGRLVSLTRDPKNSTKIGSDAGTLIWMDDKYVVRIDSPRVANADYPDQGSSAEIYTSADPLPYIELEMLGPLSTMKVGDRIERTSVYRLTPRSRRTQLPK
jgi:hypothetical protein